jgi:type VI secretion system secreted protein Hcp
MAFEAYQQVIGQKQGQFKPEKSPGTRNLRQGHELQSPILRVEYGVKTPYDVSTGATKGKRVHSILTVVKEWGASSPQSFRANVSNELITSAIFSFYTVDDSGMDHLYYTITLANGHIVNYRQFTGYKGVGDDSSAANAKNPGTYDTMELEEVGYTFETITVKDIDGNTQCTDDWTANEAI